MVSSDSVAGSAGEEVGRSPDQDSHWKTREGENPGEQPAIRVLNSRRVARDSRKGQSPETEVARAGPFASAKGSNERTNGRWVHRCGNTVDTFREEKAPKGESQERRRCEIKPTRVRRAQTVQRVPKP
jgi:hypothetical protein